MDRNGNDQVEFAPVKVPLKGFDKKFRQGAAHVQETPVLEPHHRVPDNSFVSERVPGPPERRGIRETPAASVSTPVTKPGNRKTTDFTERLRYFLDRFSAGIAETEIRRERVGAIAERASSRKDELSECPLP